MNKFINNSLSFLLAQLRMIFYVIFSFFKMIYDFTLIEAVRVSNPKILSSSMREIVLSSLWALLPLWIGLIVGIASGQDAAEIAKRSLLDGELFIAAVGYSAPIFFFMTSHNPKGKVEKQTIMNLTVFAVFASLAMFLVTKFRAEDVFQKDLIIKSSVGLFIFIAYLAFITIVSKSETESLGAPDIGVANNDGLDELNSGLKDMDP